MLNRDIQEAQSARLVGSSGGVKSSNTWHVKLFRFNRVQDLFITVTCVSRMLKQNTEQQVFSLLRLNQFDSSSDICLKKKLNSPRI